MPKNNHLSGCLGAENLSGSTRTSSDGQRLLQPRLIQTIMAWHPLLRSHTTDLLSTAARDDIQLLLKYLLAGDDGVEAGIAIKNIIRQQHC